MIDSKTWVIFVIVVIVLVFIAVFYCKESFGDPIHLNEQLNKTQSLTFQEMFPDVVPYSNTLYGLTGIEKCYDTAYKHGGTCLEYGVTGNAWWFPPKKSEPQKEITDINNTQLVIHPLR